ncbi:MAG: TIGR02677 family protein [Deltaproteobacteria bacterium]|nr:TIGR02677 family protein [Deltaproteobacteria bacterium]
MSEEGKAPPSRVLDQVPAFSYVTAQLAPTYRAMVEVFYQAKRRFQIDLRPQLVADLLKAGPYLVDAEDTASLERHLGQLVDWGILTRSHDAASVTRIEDYYRKRYVYHLTAVGEAAHRAVIEVEATIGKTGSLQTGMLGRIRATLEELDRLAGDGRPAPGRSLELFHQLFAAFDTLTQEANRFLVELNVQVKSTAGDEDAFLMRKRAVMAYLSRFIKHHRDLAGSIIEVLGRLDEGRLEGLVTAAASSKDIPPAMDERDPVEIWKRDCRDRFAGVRSWFSASQGTEATVEHLAAVAQQAVVELTRSLTRLHERRTRPADRAADFRTLARWFVCCESDDRAHELWQSAFGLRPSRHLQIAEEDPDDVDPSASWWEARPVHVPVRLRTHGSLSRAGRSAPAPDHEDAKRWIAARLRRIRAREQRARERFAGKGPVRLSELGKIGQGELELLLDLLEQALDAPRKADGTQRAQSVDGLLDVRLDRRAREKTAWARIETPAGVISCHDMLIEVRDARRADAVLEGSS